MQANDFLDWNKKNKHKSGTLLGHSGVSAGIKILRVIGIFLVSELLKSLHVVGLLCILKVVAAFVVTPLQKPFSVGSPLKKNDWSKIVQLSFFGCFIQVLWLYGITQVGPVRAILIFEHSSAAIVAFAARIFLGSGNASKTRGAVFLILGLLSLILLDRDIPVDHNDHHGHHAGLNHIFYHVLNWFGVADHKGGVLVLIIAVFLNAGYDSVFKKVSVEVGGSKRLFAITTLISAVILIPMFLITMITHSYALEESIFEVMVWLLFAAIFVFVTDFYVQALPSQQHNAFMLHRYCPCIMFITALLFSYVWYTPYRSASTSDLLHGHGMEEVEHRLSGGLIVSLIFSIMATFSLTSPHTPKAQSGQFIGYADKGTPLFMQGEDFLQRASQSALDFTRTMLHQILESPDSRSIFWFLCLNLAFCGVEFVYGVWTNSLGLISDAFHMLFDCCSLVMGLVASVMSRWPPNRTFSHGYGRVEVLSGFINALFLIVIALFIFLEAVERMIDPPDVQHKGKLLTVAVLGLLVNLFGMFSFSHAHSHGGGSDHGHSHGGESHGHSHGGGNANMMGVYLHVLADTMGSVFVIISSLIMGYYGWLWIDPLCSLILAVLIVGSALPLLRNSAMLLSQSAAEDGLHGWQQALAKIHTLEGVESYSNSRLWQLKDGENIASIHVQARKEANQQQLTQQVQAALRTAGCSIVTVQVEKTSFDTQIHLLCPSYVFGQRIPNKRIQDNVIYKAM